MISPKLPAIYGNIVVAIIIIRRKPTLYAVYISTQAITSIVCMSTKTIILTHSVTMYMYVSHMYMYISHMYMYISHMYMYVRFTPGPMYSNTVVEQLTGYVIGTH